MGVSRLGGKSTPGAKNDEWKYSKRAGASLSPTRCTLHTRPGFHSRECADLQPTTVYVIELAIKMSPMPVSVQRKDQAAAEALYQHCLLYTSDAADE